MTAINGIVAQASALTRADEAHSAMIETYICALGLLNTDPVVQHATVRRTLETVEVNVEEGVKCGATQVRSIGFGFKDRSYFFRIVTREGGSYLARHGSGIGSICELGEENRGNPAVIEMLKAVFLAAEKALASVNEKRNAAMAVTGTRPVPAGVFSAAPTNNP